ncbi:MAG TPA: SPFH domain-containing protein [Methanosarcina sp.]|nr:SPFH domain-containing protein [Methanosarcina sp.]
MKTRFIAFCLMIMALAGCTRIETGEVGIRRNFDKTISSDILQPGSWNQELWGEVLVFMAKDTKVDINDVNPIAADNSTMKEFDMSVIYAINPTYVPELYSKRAMGFHVIDNDGEILLMQNYIAQTARNAAYKEARKYAALEMGDHRQEIETAIRASILNELTGEGLDKAILIKQVQIRKIQTADSIAQSANSLVVAKNELAKKTIEVQTAQKEADRISILNQNKGAIAYMNAMANMKIAEGLASGQFKKVIVVPHDFKGIVNTSDE